MLRFHKISYVIAFFAPIFFVMSSCKQNTDSVATKYEYVFENVIRSDKGLFRGSNLGDSVTAILAKEPGKPREEEKNYLYYEYKIDSAATFNVRYTFDERGLNEIESDIFIANDTNLAEETFNKFKKYLDDHYGESETERGYNVWSVKSEKYGDVMIDLNNELPAFNSKNAIGKISLWIYTDKQ